MKKLCFIGIILALTPNLSFGDNFRINKLVQEKQRKMAELEKCMGSTKGLKIAGISTLGLTAVGVVGNVAEAKKIKEYDDKIESTERSISKTQKQIDETRADLAKRKAEAEEKKRQAELKKNCRQSEGTWEEDGYCVCGKRNYNSTTGKCEDVIIATVQLANGNTVTGVLNPATGVLTDTNGSVVNTTGGTIVSTATVAAGTDGGTSAGGTDGGTSTGGTDGGTSTGGTDVNGGSGDGGAGVPVSSTDTEDKSQKCGISCDATHKDNQIACVDNKKMASLYECKNGEWKEIKQLNQCKDVDIKGNYVTEGVLWKVKQKQLKCGVFGDFLNSQTYMVENCCYVDGNKKTATSSAKKNTSKSVKEKVVLSNEITGKSNNDFSYALYKDGASCYCQKDDQSCTGENTCSFLQSGQWASVNGSVTFIGTVTGNNPCDCKLTHYINENNERYEVKNTQSETFSSVISNCGITCGLKCRYHTQDTSCIRKDAYFER